MVKEKYVFFIKGDHAWGWWDNKYYAHLGRKYLDSLTVALLVEYLSEYEREDESDVWWSEILIQQNGKKHEQIAKRNEATQLHTSGYTNWSLHLEIEASNFSFSAPHFNFHVFRSCLNSKNQNATTTGRNRHDSFYARS